MNRTTARIITERAKRKREKPRNESLDSIAANAGCFEGVDLQTVAGYRKRLLNGDVAPPILLWKANRDRFHVISDGHHRVRLCGGTCGVRRGRARDGLARRLIRCVAS